MAVARDPRVHRRPEHKGVAVTQSPIVDYGIGNLGSVTKAFRHVGAEAVLTGDPEVLRRADALVLPGDGAFGATMDEIAAPRPACPCCARPRTRARRCSASASACSSCSRRARSTAATAGLGLLPGRVRRFDGRPARAPHGLEPAAAAAAAPAAGRACADGATSTSSTRTTATRRPTWCWRVTDYGRDFAGHRRPRQRAGRAVPSREEPGAWACAWSTNFVRACVAGARAGGRRPR